MEQSWNIIWKNVIKKRKLRIRPVRSIIEHVFEIKQLIEKTNNYGQEVHFTFVDMEKAYDTVPLQKLWEALDDIEINKIVLNANKKCTNIKIG